MQDVRSKAFVAGLAADLAVNSDEINAEWSLSLARQYVEAVVAQQAKLAQQLEQVATSTLADNEEAVDGLVESASQLEALYAQIDDVTAALANVDEKVQCVAQQVRAIEQPSSVRERGASILMSIGFRSKSVAETAASSMWARVPPHVLLDGSAPLEYADRVHGAFKDFTNDS